MRPTKPLIAISGIVSKEVPLHPKELLCPVDSYSAPIDYIMLINSIIDRNFYMFTIVSTWGLVVSLLPAASSRFRCSPPHSQETMSADGLLV